VESNVSVLSDVKVLDLTWYIAGPYCTKLLADYGADVIKIEKPGEGDPARRLGPFLNDEPHPEKSGLFLHLNTNKRGITLNLKSETGKSIFKEMVKDVDILVESFSPRVMPSLGLDYETLVKINPRLVMTSISDFGQTGPYRDFKGSELIYWGLGGFMNLMGVDGREPLKNPGNVVQYQLGLTAAVATMVALHGAETSGHGDHADVNGVREELTNVNLKSIVLVAHQYNMGFRDRRKDPGGGNIYPCKDGYVGITLNPFLIQRLTPMVGLTLEQMEEWEKPEVSGDPQKLAEFRDVILLPWLLEHTMMEIVETGQAVGMMVTPYHDIEGLLSDPHFRERGFFVEIDHPATGKLTYPGAPFRMGEGSWQIRRPAPLLGQHNVEVYGELGYSKLDLVQLRQTGVI
jgi:crotonobetainyl-CoA:carnitine CoA-transferase CaiB-like acyl-CoA transferase